MEPPAEWLDYPVLLDMPSPRLRGYARETVVAEKFQAIVDLGMANSRMKDYYDLWNIGQAFEIDRTRLAMAISATFARRGTAIPDAVPIGLSQETCGLIRRHSDIQLGQASSVVWKSIPGRLTVS